MVQPIIRIGTQHELWYNGSGADGMKIVDQESCRDNKISTTASRKLPKLSIY